MTSIDELRQALEKLPPSTLVPAGWVLERLGASENGDPRAVDVEVDLTVEDVAALLKKAVPTVRAWVAAGMFPKSYRLNGKQWRIPRASIAEFQRKQQQQHGEQAA